MSYGDGYMWAYLREKREREKREREASDQVKREKSEAYLAGYRDATNTAIRVLREAWVPGGKNSLSELVDLIRDPPDKTELGE